jgi:hypothetical protein
MLVVQFWGTWHWRPVPVHAVVAASLPPLLNEPLEDAPLLEPAPPPLPPDASSSPLAPDEDALASLPSSLSMPFLVAPQPPAAETRIRAPTAQMLTTTSRTRTMPYLHADTFPRLTVP